MGILRRASERGKVLPEKLELALILQAGLTCNPFTSASNPEEEMDGYDGELIAFAANQRDEVRDLHDVASALGAQPGMKQQTFVARGCLNPWDTQQMRVFVPESNAPTLTGADGGGGRNPAGLLFAAGVVTKGNGDCFLTPDKHTSLTKGGGQAGQGYPCVFTAGFSAGQGAKAGGIGYSEEISPTLKAAESGTNMVPSILCLNDQGGQRMDITVDQTSTLRAQMGGHQPLICLNDQGGSVMDCTVDVTGTLRAQEHGHQPLVMTKPELFENHGIDSRYTGPHPVAPTLSARAGTGGNNLPLALQSAETFCIAGNTIDRQPQNGGNGLGCQEDIAYTLTATDKHAVFARPPAAPDDDSESEIFGQSQFGNYSPGYGTLRAKGGGSESLITSAGNQACFLIRRLTPMECERLQGFPDHWTDLPGASDSSRYKALGNSVAIPCVEYIMHGIALAVAFA